MQHLLVEDALGLARLSIAATLGVTDVVEHLHQTILDTLLTQGRSGGRRTSGITGTVYRSIRGVTRMVGGCLDFTLGAISGVSEQRSGSRQREEVVAALNGVVGDRLAETNNPLAIAMALRRGGQRLVLDPESLAAAVPAPSPQIVVMVHGLCLSDLRWERGASADGPDAVGLAAELAREHGMAPLFLHYNSGRHVSTNGRELAALLERLVSAWPVRVKRLSIVAHSMGGLVARSACHQAQLEGRRWVRLLRDLVFLGTPHHGAPLERAGNHVGRLLRCSPFTAPFADLGEIRSAGISDLRHGNLLEQDWHGRDRFAADTARPQPVPLPAGCRCFAIGGTSGGLSGVPARLFGDGLVPLSSALGHHDDPTRALGIEPSRQWIAEGVGHLELLDHPAVHAQVCAFLARGRSRRPAVGGFEDRVEV